MTDNPITPRNDVERLLGVSIPDLWVAIDYARHRGLDPGPFIRAAPEMAEALRETSHYPCVQWPLMSCTDQRLLGNAEFELCHTCRARAILARLEGP